MKLFTFLLFIIIFRVNADEYTLTSKTINGNDKTLEGVTKKRLMKMKIIATSKLIHSKAKDKDTFSFNVEKMQMWLIPRTKEFRTLEYPENQNLFEINLGIELKAENKVRLNLRKGQTLVFFRGTKKEWEELK